MALLDTKISNPPKIEKTAKTDRKDIVEPKKKNRVGSKVGSNDRKNLKVGPDDLEMIKLIAATRNLTMYEVVRQMVDHYLNEVIDERELKIIKGLAKNRN